MYANAHILISTPNRVPENLNTPFTVRVKVGINFWKTQISTAWVFGVVFSPGRILSQGKDW